MIFRHILSIFELNMTSVSSLSALVESARPGAVRFQNLITNVGITYLSLSVSLSVISTLLIARQLLRHRRALRQIGISDGGFYTRVLVIFVESAALYSICGLIYIPIFATNHNLLDPLSILWSSTAVIQQVYRLWRKLLTIFVLL